MSFLYDKKWNADASERSEHKRLQRIALLPVIT